MPMPRGFIHAAAAGLVHTACPGMAVSITLEADFCIEAVEAAVARRGPPEIFNTDQGNQFTSIDFIKLLAAREIKISRPLGDCRQSPAGNSWQGGLARQRLRRAPLAKHQIRGSLSVGPSQHIRRPHRDLPLSEFLQQPPPAFIA